MTKGIVYYSDNRLRADIQRAAWRTIEASGLPIVAVTLAPIDWPAARNIVLPLERGVLTMFRQILEGLTAIDVDTVFFCEHDVLYAPDHFRFTPTFDDRVYYNTHVWKVDADSGRALHYRAAQTSGLAASRSILVEHYQRRVAIVGRDGFSRAIGYEPGTHRRPERIDDLTSETWHAVTPNIDIRHAHNLTPTRWRKEQFRNQRFTDGWTEAPDVPGWGTTRGRMRQFLADVAHAEALA